MQDPQTKTHTIDITAARARVNELLNITHSLSQLINQENDFIKARNINDMVPLQNEKAQLASAYATAIRNIAEDRAIVSNAGDQLISELREVTDRFNQLTTEQQNLISVKSQTSLGLVKNIAQKAAHSTASDTYSPSGATSRQSTKAAIAINEKA